MIKFAKRNKKEGTQNMKTSTNSFTALTQKLSAVYALTNIPLYIVDNQYRLIYHTTTINISSDTFSPVAQYCIQHLHTTPGVALCIPKIQIPFSNVYYGILPIHNQQYILIGPVANQELHYFPFKNYLQKKYTLELTNLLFQLIQNTPTLNLYRFQTIVSSLAYLLFEKNVSNKQFDIPTLPVKPKKYTKSNYSSLQDTLLSKQLFFSNHIFQAVCSGNTSLLADLFSISDERQLKKSREHLAPFTDKKNTDTVTNNQYLYLQFLTNASVLMHNAILGGLNPAVAKELYLSYISEAFSGIRTAELSKLMEAFAYTLCQKVQHAKEPSCHSKLLQKCISYIQENLYKKITLEELSSSVNASIRTIQRHFKEQLNASPIDYITEQKLKEACNLLENSSYTVVEIANILSYSSQSHFTKAFKTHYQVTPNQYRQTRQASTGYQ